MKTKLIVSLCFIASSALPLLTAYAAEPASGHTSHGIDPITAELSKKQGAEFEAAFLAMMIHHHQGGIKMARLASSRAESPELKQMATEMIAMQEKEIEQMTGWLKQWHPQAPQQYKAPEAHEKMMMESVAKLEAAEGARFDQRFATDMASHHKSGVDMAELAVDRAKHQEAKAFAAMIVKMQTKERNELLKIALKESSKSD